MRIDIIMTSLKMLAKADAAIVETTLRHQLSQLAVRIVALFIAMFGLVMLGFGCFVWLQESWGTVRAALFVSLGSFVLAAIVGALSFVRVPTPQLDLAWQTHETALELLSSEAKSLRADSNLVQQLLPRTLDDTFFRILGPIAMLLLRYIRRKFTQKQQT